LKRLILVLALLVTLVQADELDDRFDGELKKLSYLQIEVLHDSLRKGSPFNLSWSMTAIAWEESNFGKNRVGRTTPDYGVYQINLKTFKDRYADVIKRHNSSDAEIIEMLKYNDELNFSASLTEIQYWLHVYKGDHYKAWASYNGGWKGSKRYANIIQKRIKALKKFMAKHHKENNIC